MICKKNPQLFKKIFKRKFHEDVLYFAYHLELNGKMDKALDLYYMIAEDGNSAEMQFSLFKFYFRIFQEELTIDGITKDLAYSNMMWYLSKAAKQRYQEARKTLKHLLGDKKINIKNLGYEKNSKNIVISSVRNLEQDAMQGDIEAQYQFAKLLYYGIGFVGADVEAFKWCQKAAEQNHVKAQYLLGEFYSLAVSVDPDDAKAIEWYTKAAEQGYEKAESRIKQIQKLWT